MQCKNHPAVGAVGRCVGCAESFCFNCLVNIHGQNYCGSCKVLAVKGQPMVEAATTRCKEAGEALTFSIVGLLIPGCWIGIIFQVIAISKSVKAKKMMRDNPSLSGWGKTNAAILLGAIGLLFSVLQIVSRVGG